MKNPITKAGLAGLLALCASCAAAGERLEGRQAVPSPDGSVVAVLPSPMELRLVGAADGAVLAAAALPSPGLELAFAPDGRKAAVSLHGGGFLVAEVGRPVSPVQEPGGVCYDLSWSQDGRHLRFVASNPPPSPLVAGSVDLKVWEAAGGAAKPLHRIRAERTAPGAATPVPRPQEPPVPPKRRNEPVPGLPKAPK